jgi:hypothetical protein
MIDMINHPPHYAANDVFCSCGKHVECIDIVKNQNFCIGNAVKHLWRYTSKNGIEDLKKALWYLTFQAQQGEYVFREVLCSKCLATLRSTVLGSGEFSPLVEAALEGIFCSLPLRHITPLIKQEIFRLSTENVDN